MIIMLLLFGGSMTIPEMQEYSLVYSENTPAYALAETPLVVWKKFYGMLDKYGKSKGEVKTIQMHGNKTTTDYYIQVLDYLWKHQEDYKDISNIWESLSQNIIIKHIIKD